MIKYERIKSNASGINQNKTINSLKLKTGIAELRNVFFTGNGFNFNWTYEYVVDLHFGGYYNNFAVIISNIYNFDLSIIDTFSSTHYVEDYNDKIKLIKWINPNRIFYNFVCGGNISYNFTENKLEDIKNGKLPASEVILVNNDNTIYWVRNTKPNPTIIKTDELYNTISELTIQDTLVTKFLADTLTNGLNLILKKKDNSFKYFSISPENIIHYEKSFSLDTNITLSNIKSVNDNLVLLYGSVEDKVNNTSYAYFGKYHPLENLVEDTILYSRKDIRKIERINDKWYAAIGQSRGRQGYLILDTNLQQVKDIRVDSLNGEIKDILLHDNKVYLFTEKIIIEATNSLGPNERYQTTGSVLELPEEIIASVENYPVITGNSFTHSVFPNPANDMFQLKIGSNVSGNYTVKLYDLFGREVMKIFDGMIESGTEKVFNLPVSGLNMGTYYYTINNGFNTDIEKVMVVR